MIMKIWPKEYRFKLILSDYASLSVFSPLMWFFFSNWRTLLFGKGPHKQCPQLESGNRIGLECKDLIPFNLWQICGTNFWMTPCVFWNILASRSYFCCTNCSARWLPRKLSAQFLTWYAISNYKKVLLTVQSITKIIGWQEMVMTGGCVCTSYFMFYFSFPSSVSEMNEFVGAGVQNCSEN